MGVGQPGARLGEGGVEFGATRVLRGIFGLAEGEDGVFQGTGTVEAPAAPGDGLGEIGFEGADGGESFADTIAMLVERFPVFRGGVDDDLAGESVAEGVEGGTLSSCGSTWTRGKLCVFAAGLEL
ncbi:MAG TPA: hypothetical protein VI756_17255 [Blastocatellia bacterium]